MSETTNPFAQGRQLLTHGQFAEALAEAAEPALEVLMNDSIVSLSRPTIPPEVQEFAVEKGVTRYLSAVIDLARQAFPSAALCVSLGQDDEDETHRYIALDVKGAGQTAQELLAGQRAWSAEITRVCPSRHAVYFVLGWQ